MNFKSILTSLFVLVYSFSNAQESNAHNYFSSVSSKTLYCGDKLIQGTLNPYHSDYEKDRSFFLEDNRFFLEIALDSNSQEYISLPTYKRSLTSPNQAEFLLPDNLEIGKKYRIRMKSTSPALQGNFVSFVYAAGLAPFMIDFEQSYVTGKNQEAYLVYKVSGVPNLDSQLENFGYYVNKKYDFELSDGSRSTSYSMMHDLTVFPLDSITTYKINKVANTCGTQGESKGVATVKWSVRNPRTNITTVDGSNEVCQGIKFGLKVESNFITATTDITVEFSTTYNFTSTFTVNNLRVDKDNVLWVDIPDQIEESTYFYCRIKASSTYSNRLTLIKLPKITKAIPTFSLYDINVGRMIIHLENSQGNSIYSNIKSIEINGKVKNYEGLYFEYVEFPMPKKDTTFVVSKVVTACGSIPVEPRDLKISSDDLLLLTTTYDKNEYCINENITGKYTLSDPSHLANIDLKAYSNATGYFYSSETGEPGLGSRYTFFGDSPISFDREQQTFSAKVAGHVYSNLGGWVETNYST